MYIVIGFIKLKKKWRRK